MSDLQSQHPIVLFLRRRIARGMPYGLGFTVAFLVVIAALAGFVSVVDAVTEADDLARFDAMAHEVVYDTFGASPRLGLAVTWFGNNATLIGFVVVVALALVLARRYWAALRVVAASGLGGLVVLGLKALFARERPADQVIQATGFSFPSGHAFASTVFYGMMVYLVFRLTERTWTRAMAVVIGPLMILAVGLSRVYLNVHYLSDVLGGWLAGATWLGACLLVIDVVETRYRSRSEVREERNRPDDADPQPHGSAA